VLPTIGVITPLDLRFAHAPQCGHVRIAGLKTAKRTKLTIPTTAASAAAEGGRNKRETLARKRVTAAVIA
jgi:hypothetical protein